MLHLLVNDCAEFFLTGFCLLVCLWLKSWETQEGVSLTWGLWAGSAGNSKGAGLQDVEKRVGIL